MGGYSCDECDKTFSRRYDVLRHKHLKHAPGAYAGTRNDSASLISIDRNDEENADEITSNDSVSQIGIHRNDNVSQVTDLSSQTSRSDDVSQITDASSQTSGSDNVSQITDASSQTTTVMEKKDIFGGLPTEKTDIWRELRSGVINGYHDVLAKEIRRTMKNLRVSREKAKSTVFAKWLPFFQKKI